MTAIVINTISVIAFIIAFIFNRKKTQKAMTLSIKMFISIFPMLLIILLLIALLFGFISEGMLERFIGDQSGTTGRIVVAFVGAMIQIPAILAFPLSASLLLKGASIQIVVTFITSLTMIGIVSLPLEVKELGSRFAISRNLISLIGVFLISVLMGFIYGI